jgi:hypothetical protein
MVSLFKYKVLRDFQDTLLPLNELIYYYQILIAIFGGIFLKLSLASSRAQVYVSSSGLGDMLCLILINHHITNRVIVHQEYCTQLIEKHSSSLPKKIIKIGERLNSSEETSIILRSVRRVFGQG